MDFVIATRHPAELHGGSSVSECPPTSTVVSINVYLRIPWDCNCTAECFDDLYRHLGHPPLEKELEGRFMATSTVIIIKLFILIEVSQARTLLISEDVMRYLGGRFTELERINGVSALLLVCVVQWIASGVAECSLFPPDTA